MLCEVRASDPHACLMLTHNRRWLVVFTQGFPALQHFAQERFLPSNPFSSSCLWLDQDDFKKVNTMARVRGLPCPLRIDPYAHHPTLSRYASGKGLASSPDTAHGRQRGRPRKGDRHVADEVHAPAALPKRPRGRPQGSSAAATAQRTAGAADTREDTTAYEVPICTLTLTKPLYLYNMDQMQSRGGLLTGTALSPDGAGEEDEDSVGITPSNSTAHAALGASRGAPPHAADSASLSLSRPTNALMWSAEMSLAGGIFELQRRFPNPSQCLGPFRQRRTMFSIAWRRPFSGQRQLDLQTLANRHGYQSVWWGTPHQWLAAGAISQRGQCEHVISVPFTSKLVHLSLLADAAAVMAQCSISAKRRQLCYYFRASNSAATAAATVLDGAPSGPETLFMGASPSYAAALGDSTSESTFYELLQEDMRVNKWKLPLFLTGRQMHAMGLTLRPDAVGFHGFNRTVVRVFSMQGIAGLHAADRDAAASPRSGGGDVRSGLGEDRVASHHGSSAAHHADGLGGPLANPAGAAPANAAYLGHKTEFWYHISQVHFPDSYLVPSAVLSAELESPRVPLAGATGRRLPYAALTYERLLLDRPEVAAVLLPTAAHHNTETPRSADAEAEAPHTGACELPENSGSDGATSGAGSDDSSSSCGGGGATAVGDEAAELDEVAIARFVATHASPTHTQGRSLWYRADEVLDAGGIVDVNSAPVEVHVPRTTVQLPGNAEGYLTGGSGEPLSSYEWNGSFFNVECLTDPDEALRLLSVPFAAR